MLNSITGLNQTTTTSSIESAVIKKAMDVDKQNAQAVMQLLASTVQTVSAEKIDVFV